MLLTQKMLLMQVIICLGGVWTLTYFKTIIANSVNNNIMTTTFTPTLSLHLNESYIEDGHLSSKNDNPIQLPFLKYFKAVQVNSRSILLSWNINRMDSHSNKSGYTIFYMLQDTKNVEKIDVSSYGYNLTNLAPFSTYNVSIRVNGLSVSEEDVYDDSIEVRTDVDPPGSPRVTNVSCYGSQSIYVQWNRPEIYNNSIDFYFIYYRVLTKESKTLASIFSIITVETNVSSILHRFQLDKLIGQREYIIKICAGTKSIIKEGRTYKGEFSDSHSVYLPLKDCINDLNLETNVSHSLKAGFVLGILLAIIVLSVSIVGFILYRRCFALNYNSIAYEDEPSRLFPPPGIPDWEQVLAPDGKTGSIFLEDFEAHVALLHADGDIGFSKEYEEIQKFSLECGNKADQCLLPDNKPKNRYLNIVAYDHSRVELSVGLGQRRTCDYINANFIDGFDKFHAYIGTQGPLEFTFDAFWKMIWEQNVFVIVMITNIIERGRRKCDMYWPKEKETDVCYDSFEVTLLHEECMAHYIVRTFKLRNLKLKKRKGLCVEREVRQFHYTSWPDHGTPSHPLPVLSFVRKSAGCNPNGGGPVVVHCSAGVGRTGTYIVIDTIMRQMEQKRSLNIYGFLKHIRYQRNHLVQTEEQYVFIHDALLEASRSGNTEVSALNLTDYIELLMTNCEEKDRGLFPLSPSTDTTLLAKQFQLITEFKPSDFHYMSAKKSVNILKNRDSTLLPVESFRVSLAPKPGVEGSDYINATWLHGHSKLKEFVMTQHPCETTKFEFWRMLWDHNAQTVVLLTPIDEDDYLEFWPLSAEEELDLDSFRVRFVEMSVHGENFNYDFVLSSSRDDYEVAVRFIHCPHWPLCVLPDEAMRLFDVLKLVQNWHLEYQDGPLIVVDQCGGREGATFCALATLCKQLDRSDAIDIYQVAKLYHDRRPGIWHHQADILYLYQAMEVLVTSNIINPLHVENVSNSCDHHLDDNVEHHLHLDNAIDDKTLSRKKFSVGSSLETDTSPATTTINTAESLMSSEHPQIHLSTQNQGTVESDGCMITNSVLFRRHSSHHHVTSAQENGNLVTQQRRRHSVPPLNPLLHSSQVINEENLIFLNDLNEEAGEFV